MTSGPDANRGGREPGEARSRDRLPGWRIGGLAAAAVLAMLAPVGRATADDVRPVHLEITERTPGAFTVQWRVPRVMPPNAMPGPVLPQHCRADDRVDVEELAAAWINRQPYACSDGLAGHEIGMAFPRLNVALSTLVRVELLSGESYSHMLLPGERAWRVPDIDAGGFPRRAQQASRIVAVGAVHALNPAHVALLLALCLFGTGRALRLAGAFSTGQVLGVGGAAIAGLQAGAGLAELAVAVAAGVLARQALLAPEARRQLVAVAAAAGAVHGLGLASLVDAAPAGDGGAGWSVLVTLGTDGAMVATALLVGAAVRARGGARTASRAGGPRAATLAASGVAIGAFTIAMVPPTGSSMGPGGAAGLRLAALPVPAAGVALGNTGRVAAQFPDAAIQSYVAIDAFEVRRETLVRVGALAAELGLVGVSQIDVTMQPPLRDRVAALIAEQSTLRIDGAVAVPSSQRVDFMEVDNQGALPRSAPVPERVDAALLGVTTVYLRAATPRQVALEWTDFSSAAEIPATVTDPEASGATLLSADAPVAVWDNALVEDPAPVVTATAVAPALLWLPLASLAVLLGTAALTVGAGRKRPGAGALALARLTLPGALLFAPLANVAVAMPESLGATPDAREARKILSGVLPNIYKAFEFRSEEAAFERLALSVTGETLTDVYLEQQRALEMEERGGARARVEAFEITDVRAVEAAPEGGFVAEASWNIGGTVVHFGHRHFRQNGYVARVLLVPIDGAWKLRSIAVLDERRLR